MKNEWLTTPGQLERSRDELEGRAIPTIERVIVAVIVVMLSLFALFLAGVVHQLKPNFFPTIWEAITTWGGIWPRIG